MALLERKKKPNQRLARFKELCSQGNTAEEAGKSVGFADTTAIKYRTKYAKEIKAMAAERFDQLAPEAIKTLHGLLADKSGNVRLGAVNRILEGAELGIVHKSEVTYFKTDQQLDDELLEACGGSQEKVLRLLALIQEEEKKNGLEPGTSVH